MPADRLFHPRAGHSEKVSQLTDLEYRVWTQYVLSADDFGVMRATAVTVQADNDALAAKKPHVIQRCLDMLLRVGLVLTFSHQGRHYLYQYDWQKWQKVEYPRATNEPKPPADALALCDATTQELFDQHPGGKSRKRPKDSPNESQINPEQMPTTRTGAPAERLTANANGQRPTANAYGAPLVDRHHRNHAHCGRVCLPASLFSEFVRRRNHATADEEIRNWAMSVENEWSEKPDEPGDAFDFWKARYAEKWPAVVSSPKASRLPAWARDAS